ncbi:type II secretion system F family protein [Streptomyces sp. 4N509B]|uniref:type II secretion system F family protein n=1 Tax=Streptomyces sp. 4N509B TaxID=3457413 RepID=UPI003FD3CD54
MSGAVSGAVSGHLLPAAQLAAALCVGAGAWLLIDGGDGRRRARLLSAAGGAAVPAGTRWPRLARRWRPRRDVRRWRWPDALTVRVWVCCLAGGAVVAWWGGSPLPLLAAVALAPLALRRWRSRAERLAADRRREAVIELCGTLAVEVRAGRTPGDALADACQEGLGEQGTGVRAAARYGGDVADALRRASAQPGAEGLRGVAACWRVAVDGGASFAAGLERVARALRSEQDQREELRAQLAGPRATVLVLAVLPVFGLLLGSAMGVRPLWELLHSPVGLACLVAGAGLEWAGVAWAAAIARAAERGTP